MSLKLDNQHHWRLPSNLSSKPVKISENTNVKAMMPYINHFKKIFQLFKLNYLLFDPVKNYSF